MLPIHTILHPTDFSESSDAALRLAHALARDYAARLVLLHAYPPPFNGAEAIDRRRPEGVEEDLLAKLQGLMPDDRTVAIDCRVSEGHAAGAILDAADEVHADLIVMGTHGRGGLRRAVLGSVAEAVSRKAACPVATVRPAVALPAEETPRNAGSTMASKSRHQDPDVEPGVGDPVRGVEVPVGSSARPVLLPGTLRWLERPRGVIVFAHGSGSSRQSPRNQFVSQCLVQAGFATLLLDLLTEQESENRENVFDIALLADRLAAAAEWATLQPELAGLPVGYFGASTGSAAALMAAASHPGRVSAIVSRGGRPDLAWDDLPSVQAPTLLIVGGADEPVLGWNRESLARLAGIKQLKVVPGATHLFEEPGALEQVADMARDWFIRHLSRRAAGRPG